MTKKLFLLIFCLFSFVLNAQKDSRYDENDIAEFQLEDGSSFKAYIIGTVTNTLNVGQIIIHNRISGFKYATLDDQKKKEISAKDVKKVIYYNGGEVSQIQEKIKVKTVDKDASLSNETAETFEYLLYDGKIKLYSSNVFECLDLTNCYYTHSNFYIKKPDDAFTVLAVKTKSQFNTKMGSSIEKIVPAFRAIGGNCSSFSKYLDDFDKNMMKDKQLDKTLQKEYQEIYKTTLKEVKNDRERLRKLFHIVADKVQSRQAEIYLGLIKEYEKNCP